ncbi:MAG: sulfite exporter TauE/SafE family protein [Alphaproteobacteria bacterium]
MESQFLGVPDIDGWIFFGLTVAAFVTAVIGMVTGTGGGLVLLALMAIFFTPAVLIPMHTVVQLGSGFTRAIQMWSWVLKPLIPPFLIGIVIGAVLGTQIFFSLSSAALQAVIGGAIITLAWLPKLARAGGERNRFAVLGFLATFLGVFISATGTMLSPFIASASPDRRNHAATMAALMGMVHIAKLVAFGVVGVAIGAYAPLMVAMIMAGMLGNWVGVRALNRIPERLFRIVFQVLLTVLALRMLWRAAVEYGLI